MTQDQMMSELVSSNLSIKRIVCWLFRGCLREMSLQGLSKKGALLYRGPVRWTQRFRNPRPEHGRGAFNVHSVH